MRWMHRSELRRPGQRTQFDPVAEGARHALSHERSLAIWVWACADATDGAGRRDEARARRRFHELSACLGAHGGRIAPDGGRITRVGPEIDGEWPGAWASDELMPRVPGRETLVAVEARRWAN